MADDINRQRVLNFLAAYYSGDADAAMKCCSDDVLFMVYLPVELFPHLGPQRGSCQPHRCGRNTGLIESRRAWSRK
ncbi:hypothetical protein [Bradyrhizobium sp.]|uniref:hypothetical protein n=1 Tax=Bradyrhizobium sp. TaxID=376 RepID=UPI004037A1CE